MFRTFGAVRRLIREGYITWNFLALALLGLVFQRLRPQRTVDFGPYVLLLANGPSLRGDLQSLDTTAYSSIVAVNAFASSPEFRQTKPSFLILADTFWFDEPETWSLKARQVMEALRYELDWPLQLLFPSQHSKSSAIQYVEKNPNITLVPLPQMLWPRFNAVLAGFDTLGLLTRTHKRVLFWLWKKRLGEVLPNGVAATAIFEILRGRTSRLDIIGLDMSLALDLAVGTDGIVEFVPKHFYGKASTPEVPIGSVENPTMASSYRAIAEKFEVFYLLDEYSKLIGCRVRNLSSGTLLDAFLR